MHIVRNKLNYPIFLVSLEKLIIYKLARKIDMIWLKTMLITLLTLHKP